MPLDTFYMPNVPWVRLFRSEGPAGGHPARPPAVPGPLTRRAGPAVPPATARHAPATRDRAPAATR